MNLRQQIDEFLREQALDYKQFAELAGVKYSVVLSTIHVDYIDGAYRRFLEGTIRGQGKLLFTTLQSLGFQGKLFEKREVVPAAPAPPKLAPREVEFNVESSAITELFSTRFDRLVNMDDLQICKLAQELWVEREARKLSREDLMDLAKRSLSVEELKTRDCPIGKFEAFLRVRHKHLLNYAEEKLGVEERLQQLKNATEQQLLLQLISGD